MKSALEWLIRTWPRYIQITDDGHHMWIGCFNNKNPTPGLVRRLGKPDRPIRMERIVRRPQPTVSFCGKKLNPARVLYARAHNLDELPARVRRICDRPGCVNPDHHNVFNTQPIPQEAPPPTINPNKELLKILFMYDVRSLNDARLPNLIPNKDALNEAFPEWEQLRASKSPAEIEEYLNQNESNG